MSRLKDTLDVLSERGEAAFATDSSDRIVLWNAGCETMLGFPAQEALGRHCFEVLKGRDINGNTYCFQNCPVAYQAREDRERPVNSFTLVVRDSNRNERHLWYSMFAIHAVNASLSSVIHVLREVGAKRTGLDEELHKTARETAAPRWPLQSSGERAEIQLTTREKEILRCMAEGIGTADIARRLSISGVTVRNHTQSILQKLDVHTKLAAVVFAFRNKLI